MLFAPQAISKSPAMEDMVHCNLEEPECCLGNGWRTFVTAPQTNRPRVGKFVEAENLK